MSDDDDREGALNQLAQEFSESLRRGNRPTIAEFAASHPALASEIRELFPTLLMLEGKHESQAQTSSFQELPSLFGEFRILRKVGEGGMGQVYEAMQVALGRRVALKVLHKSVTKPRLIQRFSLEARVLAKLNHTNIVPLFDFGEVQGVLYYAMQFIDGISLDRFLNYANRIHGQNHRVSGAPLIFDQLLTLPPHDYQRQIAKLGAHLADALSQAHTSGILHRDVKPANILFDSGLGVWLADFGLASLEGEHDITTVGDVVGTLRYIPPERFQGITDPRGDLYGLGATLYELLALRPVFSSATSAELIRKILHEQPILLRQVNPLISRDLETVVHKAMARDVDDRYQSAAELSLELLRFHNDEPVKARRSSTAEKLLRIGRRNPVIASMVSVIAMLLVIICVISVFASVRMQQQLSQTRSAQRTGLMRLYDSLLMQASVTRKSDKEGRRFRALSLLQDASLDSQQLGMSTQSRQALRDEATATLCVADARNRPPFEAWPLGTVALDFDPSLERYARINSAGEITILRTVDQRRIEVIPADRQGKPGAFSGREVRFSHDGRWLLQLLLDEKNDQWLRVWNMAQTPAQMAWERSQVVTGSLGFTPDSRYVFVRLGDVAGTDLLQPGADASLPTWFRLLCVESGTESLNGIAASVDAAIAFHPELECFALSDNEKVSIIDFASREPLAQWRLPSVTHLLFNSDGETLFATTSADGCVHCWDATTQLELSKLRDEFPEPVATLLGDHRGDILISTSKFTLQAWEISSRRLLWEASSPLSNLRFSRDDKSLAGIHRADPKVSLLEVAGDRELIRIATDLVRRGEDSSVDDKVVAVLHPSRKLFAATTAGGTILWDIDRAQQCGFLPGRRIPLGFDSNGTLLTYAPLPEGLRRWQISPSAERTGAFTHGAGEALYWVDEAQQLHQVADSARWASSRDGNVLAMAAHSQGTFVYIADQSEMTSASRPVYRRLQLDPQYDVLWTSVSSDGKWVATGSSRWAAKADDPVSVTVWDAHSGKRHKDLLTGHTGTPTFSPDGKCLCVLSGGYRGGVRWWDVDTWLSGPQPAAVEAPGGVTKAAFDAAHGWLAIQGEDVRVLDIATSHETFRLQTHEPSSLAPQFFTADGSHLVAVDLGSGEILIWNLALIQQEMQSLGLAN